MSKHRISPAKESRQDTKQNTPAQTGAAMSRSEDVYEPITLQQRFLRAAVVLTTAYLCAMFIGHPLIFTSFYFNITETKQAYFLIVSGLYLLLLLFARIALPPISAYTRPHVPLLPPRYLSLPSMSSASRGS
jgi:phosphate starvation-inducible membrane PsiE